MPDQQPPYTVSHEVRNGDLETIKEICSRIQLDSDLTRFRIEIDSKSPILPEQMTEADTSTKPQSKAESVEKGFQRFDGKEETTEETKVLSHTSGKDPSIGTFNIGSNAWKVASFLFRQNEPLRLGHIEAYLEDTKYEIGYKSLSATLSSMKNEGIVDKKDMPDSHYQGYTLSETGEKKVQNTVDKADKYPLTTADKIAGLHPTNNYDPPDLEAA